MFRPALFALLLAVCALAVGLRAVEPARRTFNLPAGPAETTLRLFAEQAGGQFVFSSERVAGVRTRKVKGQFTKQEALDRMLEGTGLRAIQDRATGALAVERAGGADDKASKERNGKTESRSLAPAAP